MVPNWKSEYFDLLAEAPERALSLKAGVLCGVKFLYRYRPLSGYGLVELITGRVYLAKAHELNDPYECKLLLNQSAARNCGSVYGALAFAGLKIDTRMAALSETPRAMLMWAHYANRPKGCCLEYAVDDLSLDQRLAPGLNPVHYDSKGLFDANQLAQQPKDKLKALLVRAACHKLESWSYEKEWRLIDLVVSAPLQLPTLVGLPGGFWGSEFAAAQSAPIGFDENGARYIELPNPRRIVFFGDQLDQELVRLIRGIQRLSNIPLALAELHPDAAPGQELEIRDL